MSDNIIKDLIKTIESVSGGLPPIVYLDHPWTVSGENEISRFEDGDEYTLKGSISRKNGHLWFRTDRVTQVFPESKEVSTEEFEEIVHG